MILITGASGFVGSALTRHLRAQGEDVRACSRQPLGPATLAGAENLLIAGSFPNADWSMALRDVDEIVHTAARVHVIGPQPIGSIDEYEAVNVRGTLNLARQAARARVRRLVFLSSIKVNGERTGPGQFFRASDVPAPVDLYGVSKARAEDGLRDIAARSSLEVVIVRPPLVYGPGVRANFYTMMKALSRGLPLPLAGIDNRRSLVGLDNLVDLLRRCLRHSRAANETFLASDDHDLSTSELLQQMGCALGTSARLFAAPAGLLTFAASVLGKQEQAKRLLESLRVDVRPTREWLDWDPPVGLDVGFRRTAEAFLRETRV